MNDVPAIRDVFTSPIALPNLIVMWGGAVTAVLLRATMPVAGTAGAVATVAVLAALGLAVLVTLPVLLILGTGATRSASGTYQKPAVLAWVLVVVVLLTAIVGT